MKSDEIRKRFLDFYEMRGHVIIPSSSLIPENDPSSLFINSGMQPLVPYLLGQTHPKGVRLANFQKVIRTIDIDEVGDNTHLTFFEMMGNWSLGDYFKEDAIKWSFELLTKEFGLDLDRIYITCFEGDDNSPKDIESAEVWQSLGVPLNHIYFMGADSNWWSPGENGPCGPDTEMFYDMKGTLNLTSKEEFIEADERQDVVEIGNNVFIQYRKEGGEIIGELDQKNVDVGWGFERVVIAVQEKNNIFETDLFEELMTQAELLTDNSKKQIILADHIKASVFLIADGVRPSNTDHGYILRRLIRRAIFNTINRDLGNEGISTLVDSVIGAYKSHYKKLVDSQAEIKSVIEEEVSKFRKTLQDGLKHFEKLSKDNSLSGQDAFRLFSTYGFPFELTKEIAEDRGIKINEKEFEEEFKKHQEASRTASAGKFKGGLASSGEMETKFHTATHLLHAALREILGDHVFQKGSNITPERLRFDFSHTDKMTTEQKLEVEEWVNDKIKKALPVSRHEMTFGEAKGLGAMGLFEDKYGDKVSVYTIGDEDSEICSRELCGGPHTLTTADLGKFKIKKEEATSAGVRRIKAILE